MIFNFETVVSHKFDNPGIHKARFQLADGREIVIGSDEMEWEYNGYGLSMQWKNIYFEEDNAKHYISKKEKDLFQNAIFVEFVISNNTTKDYQIRTIRWSIQKEDKKGKK